MPERRRSRWFAYGVAALATVVSLLVRWPLWPVLGDAVPHMTFFPAVMIAAYFGGFWPGLLATALSAGAANYFFTQQLSSVHAGIGDVAGLAALILFVLVGTIISGLSESLHRARRRIAVKERGYAVTLASIADAVIATDTQARVTFMNPAAEALTGWPLRDARGRPLPEVFQLVNEQTREPVEDPGAKVLQLGSAVGPTKHTLLLARDGREVPIDDSAAPKIDDRGRISGVVLVFRDTTPRRRAEEAEALRASEQRFRKFVDHATDAFFLQDERGVILDVNRQACASLGYSREELVGKSPLDFDPDTTPAAIEEMARKLDAGETVAFESRHRRKDGTVFPVEIRGRRFADGDRRFLVSLARDISERKRDEALLCGQKRILERIIQGEPLAEVLTFLCRTIEELAQGEMLASVLLLDADGVHLRHGAAPSLPEAYVRAIDGLAIGPCVGSCGTAAHRREPVFVADIASDPLWAPYAHLALSHGLRACWSSPILSCSAEVLGTFAMYYRQPRQPTAYDLRVVDIVARTVAIAIERSRAEQALRESEHRWRSLTEALPQLVWTTMPDGAGDYFSTQWTQHTGVPQSRLLGWQWLDVLHPDDREPTRKRWTNAVAGCGPYDVEYRVRRSDGVYRWFKTRGVPIRNGAGQIVKWLGTCTDITTSKQLEDDLRHAKEMAEAANRAKDEFLANVSHEIRTPMNAILGMTELTLDTALTDDQRQCLKTVKSAADNLLGIINDLLDFAKIEAGKLELDSADFSLRTMVGDTLRALAVRAHGKRLELIYHVQPEVPDALVGDAGRLRQVLVNLVGNAIKFTDVGEVVVRVKSEIRISKSATDSKSEQKNPSGASGVVSSTGNAAFEFVSDFGFRDSDFRDTVVLHFEVSDTGVGIPLDKQQTIFRAFEQEDTSTTRKYGGTGLGLTIAARLVALMGGQISVDSAPGHGSTFTFTGRFGLEPQPAEPATAQPPVLLSNLPVLIVDDNASNRHILREWLRGWRMEPASAADGPAAMDALRDAATRGRPFALVLLDARMPDTDGLALAAQIRTRAELAATRLVLLTSGDRPGDGDRTRELRIDAHLLKPVQQEELLATIYQVMSRQMVSGRVVIAERSDSFSPTTHHSPLSTHLHILVAEDSEFSARLMQQLLAREGHRVRLTANGREALALALEGSFDLLLLDIHMPGLDGFGVVKAIREREQAAGGHLPIIALTARSRKEDRERCLAAGMDDFLTKPVPSAALFAAIDRLMRQDDGGSMKDEKAETSASDSSFLPHPSPSGNGLLDPVAVLTACGDDADGLRRMCQDFQTYAPARLTEVADALRDRTAPRLRQAAHKFSALLFAFSSVAGNVASDLEDHAAQGRLDEALSLVEQLDVITPQLLGLASSLSLKTLRQQARAVDDPDRTANEPA